ncbi:hypothetical protein ABPG75_011739 [Micractinium tetrahymenae]
MCVPACCAARIPPVPVLSACRGHGAINLARAAPRPSCCAAALAEQPALHRHPAARSGGATSGGSTQGHQQRCAATPLFQLANVDVIYEAICQLIHVLLGHAALLAMLPT